MIEFSEHSTWDTCSHLNIIILYKSKNWIMLLNNDPFRRVTTTSLRFCNQLLLWLFAEHVNRYDYFMCIYQVFSYWHNFLRHNSSINHRVSNNKCPVHFLTCATLRDFTFFYLRFSLSLPEAWIRCSSVVLGQIEIRHQVALLFL